MASDLVNDVGRCWAHSENGDGARGDLSAAGICNYVCSNLQQEREMCGWASMVRKANAL